MRLRTVGSLFIVAMVALLECPQVAAQSTGSSQPLAEARKEFKTKLIKDEGAKGPIEAPPQGMFSIVHYETNIGRMAAYLGNIPKDGKLHPAVIWITGGFGNDIGDMWTRQSAGNDQSAAVLRQAGLVMMYPSQRGAHDNPGSDETCLAEIDDILAAASFLAAQKGIDPKRIYLGGHSTGGTKALLAAECRNQFRAVFSLGPVGSPKDYGDEYLTFDTSDAMELKLREPIRWLKSLHPPVFVFEGTKGNIYSLRQLEVQASLDNATNIHFYEVPGKDHFSAIQPVCRAIAQEILKDDKEGEVTMDFNEAVRKIR
jgi:dipeptidyl aminopeptidase/acylaminoacyl peptidase